MKTANFFLQYAEQTKILKPLIARALSLGVTRFQTTMLLPDNWGLILIIEATSLDDFPFDNIFKCNRVLLVQDPLIWLCERSDQAICVWDGSDGDTLRCLGFMKAWPIPGFYVNPNRSLQREKI